MAGKRMPAAERRRVLIEAARSVFSDVGFEGSRTIAIAKRAGINEAMIYQHFPSKRALFEAAVVDPVRDRLEQLVKDVTVVGDSGAGPQESIGRIEHIWLMAMTDIAPLLGIALLGDSTSGQETYRTVVLPALEQLDKVVADVVQLPEDRSSWTVTRALLGANLLLGLQMAADNTDAGEIDALADLVSDLVTLGLSDR